MHSQRLCERSRDEASTQKTSATKSQTNHQPTQIPFSFNGASQSVLAFGAEQTLRTPTALRNPY